MHFEMDLSFVIMWLFQKELWDGYLVAETKKKLFTIISSRLLSKRQSTCVFVLVTLTNKRKKTIIKTTNVKHIPTNIDI